MATSALRREAPASYGDAASLLRRCAEDGLAVRTVGGRTKFPQPARTDLRFPRSSY